MNFEKLYFLREENNFTQNKIANILGVSRIAISKWENSKEIIPLDKLNIYSNVFYVSLDYIMNLSNIRIYKKYTKIKKLDSKVIGINLKKFRKEFNITQKELANFLNTTQSTISAYESGITCILTAFLYQICKNYKISMDWMCGKSNTMNLISK